MSYTVRCIPETPSASLNSWLKSHYSESTSSIPQYVLGSVICAFYEAVTAVHRAVLRAQGSLDSKTVWMAASGLVGVAVAVAAWLLFTVIMASGFIIHFLLHYAAVISGMMGVGLGAAGALYFSKDMEESSSRHGVTSAAASARSSQEFTRGHHD